MTVVRICVMIKFWPETPKSNQNVDLKNRETPRKWTLCATCRPKRSPVTLACYPVCISIPPQPSPPAENPNQSVPLCCNADPQSGFDELVNPGPQSVGRAESLKGWSDGFIGLESEGGLLLAWFILIPPEYHLHQLTSVIAAILVPLFEEHKYCLWCLS